MSKNEGKKPIFKRWWFWVIIIVIIIAIAVGGTSGGDKATSNDKTGSTSEQSKSGDVAKNDSQKPAKRDNSDAKEVTLIPGKYEVGKDVNPGRYVVTGEGSGNFFVNDSSKINEILDDGSIGFGVPSVTVDLEKGDTIELKGLNKTTFKPAKTKMSNTLTTGYWEVGLDIKAGSYTAGGKKGESGNLFVLQNSIPVVNEILGDPNSGGVESVKVDLKDGQIIHIAGINEVTFK